MSPEIHEDAERRMSDLFHGAFTGKEAAPPAVVNSVHKRTSTRGNVHERQRIGIMAGCRSERPARSAYSEHFHPLRQ